MKIVVLDGYTLNPGDNPWDPIAALGEFTVYDRTDAADIVARSQDAEIVITNKTPLREETLKALPKLQCIGILATGYDVVDIKVAGERGIPVMNVVNYGADAVAQHAFALLLELCRVIGIHDSAVRAGRWGACPDFCFWETPQIELSGKKMGILGFGTIGQKVGALAHAFGMEVLAASARRSGQELQQKASDVGYPVRYVDLDALWHESDVLSLHCPLSDYTRNIVNTQTIAKMKDGVLLLNLARGPLLAEEDVAQALQHGKIAGLGVDVVSKEPIAADNPLLSSPHTIITPHIAWATLRARQNIMNIMADCLKAWLDGAPRNVVNAAFLPQKG